MKNIKYLILGAGISGLSFASHLNSDNYLILEMEEKAGGLCRTHKEKDYIWDYAGHFFHFKNDDTRKFFEPALAGEKCVKQIKNTKIYYKGEYIDYPFQKNIHQLEKEEFIDCLYHLFFKIEKENYSSFKDMLIGKFGKGICDRFLVPYNEKLYACDLDMLDQDAMGRFFPYANIEDIIKNMKEGSNISYNDTFIYPYDGAECVINYLLSGINKANLKFNEKVLSIDVNQKVVNTEHTSYHFEYLVNSLPFNTFLELCGDNYVEQLSWNKVLVFNIGFDSPSIDKSIHWVYYPEKDLNFYRVGFYNNILNQDKLSVYIEIGFSKFDDVNIEEQYRITIDNLKKCGIITNHKVVEYEAILIDPAYVHISTDSKAYVESKKIELAKNNLYTIGRYGDWTYCSMEDCFLQARDLADQIGEIE